MQLGVRAEDDEQFANILDRRAAKLSADLDEIFGTCFAVVAVDADLDELVGLERGVDFLEHGSDKPLAGDTDNRIEVVGARAQLAALGRCKF